MIKSNCKYCGKEITKRGTVPAIFCNLTCKAEWQREQKPATREWLYQKYIVEKMSANDIAAIVHRDSKRVWEWLKDYGIETRKRGFSSTKPFQKGQSWWTGKKHPPEFSEKLRKIRMDDGRIPYLKNGEHYLKGKRGSETPNWKGGITPERAAFYSTKEWKDVIPQVWKRDNGKCQKCGRKATADDKKKKQFDIHHIVGFENISLRAELSNLVLLCEHCHYWVHSNENKEKEFLK